MYWNIYAILFKDGSVKFNSNIWCIEICKKLLVYHEILCLTQTYDVLKFPLCPVFPSLKNGLTQTYDVLK